MNEVSLVLVNTKFSRNIGACARALANMGGERLILLSPQCEVNLESYQGAAGAQKYLDQVQTYKSWSDYLNLYPEVVRVGFTARQGKNRKTIAWESLLKNSLMGSEKLHLIFGPEDNGLSEEDLSYCNFRSFLTTFGEFKSLNLAQATLIALYSFQMKHCSKVESAISMNKAYFLDERVLYDWLLKTGFQLSSPRSNAFKLLKGLFQRTPMDEKECQTLVKVLQQNIRKLDT